MNKCPLCFSEIKETYTGMADIYPIICKVCGKYQITEDAITKMFYDPYLTVRKHILSGLTREQSDKGKYILIHLGNIVQLLESISLPKLPFQYFDRILLYIYNTISSAADFKVLNALYDYPIAFAKNPNEFSYYLNNLVKLGYLENPGEGKYYLTVDGWSRLKDIIKTKPDSDQAFVAMWFDKQMDDAWENGFKKALIDTGYKPIRIDKEEHNEKICDRIISEIRKSGLMVADFTGGRGGVYYEAGFAYGLGISLIYTCRNDCVESLHFDTRQYNHIVWKTASDLFARLKNRIEATILTSESL